MFNNFPCKHLLYIMHKKITWLRKTFGQCWKSRDLSFIPNQCFHWLIQLKSLFLRTYWILLFEFGSSVVATHSGKQTHSEGQCRWWSAVYYTSRPKAEFPVSQGPWPAFVKIFYTPCVRVWTHHSKFLETYINQGKYNPNNPIIHMLCAHVLRQSNS